MEGGGGDQADLDWKEICKVVTWFCGRDESAVGVVTEGGDEMVERGRILIGWKDGKGEVEGEKELRDVVGEMMKQTGYMDKVVVEDMDGEERVWVRRKRGGVKEAIGFCRKMLKVDKRNTCVFGEKELVERCCKDEDNGVLGVVLGEGGGSTWYDGRVYVAKKEGQEGCVEGLMHHGLL